MKIALLMEKTYLQSFKELTKELITINKLIQLR